jgi:tetratricopeptide (TPR) repeat protein
MNITMLKVLKQIVSQYGPGIFSDARRVKALLSDMAAGEPRPQKNALILCLEQGFAAPLQSVPANERGPAKTKLAERLNREEGLDMALCMDTLDLLESALFEIGDNPEAARPGAVVCPQCGKPLQPDSKFCANCGARLNGNTVAQDADTRNDKDSEVEKICERAFRLYLYGENDEAIAEYTRAINLDPDCQRAYRMRGICYRKTGKFDKALDDLNKAVRLDTGDASAVFSRGKLYQKKGDYQKALTDFNKAIELNLGYWVFYSVRADLYIGQKNYPAAREDYSKSLQLLLADKDRESNKTNIAHIARILGKRARSCLLDNEYEAARRDYIEALRYADEWVLWRDKAFVENELKYYKAAVFDYGAAINRYYGDDNEELAKLYNWRGLAYAKNGYGNEALKCIEKAIELDPGEKEYEENSQNIMKAQNKVVPFRKQ